MLCLEGNNALNLISGGTAPDPAGRAYSAPSDSLVVFGGGDGEEGKGEG